MPNQIPSSLHLGKNPINLLTGSLSLDNDTRNTQITPHTPIGGWTLNDHLFPDSDANPSAFHMQPSTPEDFDYASQAPPSSNLDYDSTQSAPALTTNHGEGQEALATPDIISSPSLDSLMEFCTSFIDSATNLSFLLINARSLVPKLSAIRAVSAAVNPCFICITESWLTASVTDTAISLPGYDLHRIDRVVKTGGGCVIYSRADIKATPYTNPSFECFQESVWVSSEYIRPTVILGCIYSPPKNIIGCSDALANSLAAAHVLPFDVKVLMGDFNLPEISWSPLNGPPKFNVLLAELQAGQWNQNVRAPTRGSSTLDLIFTNNEVTASAAVGPLFPGSDHNIVACNIKRFMSTCTKSSFVYHKFTPIVLESFASILRSNDWSLYFLTDHAQSAANILYTTLIDTISMVAPPRKVSVKRKQYPKAVLKLQRKIGKLRSHYIRTHCLSVLLTMSRLSSKVTTLQLQHEIRQEQTLLNKQWNPQNLSQLARSRCFSASGNVTALRLPSDGSLTNDPQAICESLNEYFASCYSPPKNLPSAAFDLITASVSDSHAPLRCITVTPFETLKQLQCLKSSCIPGPDGIPSIPLKYGGPDLPLLLSNLFSLSLDQGVVPKQWKLSLITPRYKSGSRNLASSYRGIHHTSLLSRVLERIIKAPLIEHLKSLNLVSDRQYGFLSRRSVISCQLDFFNLISSAYDCGKQILVVFLDISKAFDQVPHAAILESLAAASISGPLHSWFKSYLSDRFQVTRIAGCTSSPARITSGVVQGSVLGPILFLLYINKALNHVKYGEPFLFADDIKIVYTFSPLEASDTMHRIQADLDQLSAWSSVSGMNFSTSKCSILLYRYSSSLINLKLNGTPLSIVPTIRDLGVYYSSSFSFTHQAQFQIAKARKLCFMILRSFHLTPVKLIIYKQRVRPILEYCSMLFSNYAQHDRHAIERVQRMFTKALFPKSSLTTYRHRCTQLNLEPLWLRRLKLNLHLLHSMVYNQIHTSVTKATWVISSGYNLRDSAYKLKVESAATVFRHNFFLPFYSRLWNKLPADIRSIETRRLFTRSLNSFLTLDKVDELLTTQMATDSLFELGPRNA